MLYKDKERTLFELSRSPRSLVNALVEQVFCILFVVCRPPAAEKPPQHDSITTALYCTVYFEPGDDQHLGFASCLAFCPQLNFCLISSKELFLIPSESFKCHLANSNRLPLSNLFIQMFVSARFPHLCRSRLIIGFFITPLTKAHLFPARKTRGGFRLLQSFWLVLRPVPPRDTQSFRNGCTPCPALQCSSLQYYCGGLQSIPWASELVFCPHIQCVVVPEGILMLSEATIYHTLQVPMDRSKTKI